MSQILFRQLSLLQFSYIGTSRVPVHLASDRGLQRLNSRTFDRCFRILSLLIFLLTPLYAIAAETSKTLTLLTWEDYIDSELVADFEQRHQVKINQVFYESDSGRDELLSLYGAVGYDLILVDDSNIPGYQQLGWITPLPAQDSSSLSQLQLPLPRFRQFSATCAPYFWGTTGIAYRKDLVDEPITSWKQLFHPSEALQGKILMPLEADETIGAALKSLGYSMSSSNKQELAEARKLLHAQAPSVKSYSSVANSAQESQLVSGDIVALITYNSDALMLQEEEPNITYVLPEEGGAIWADFFCLSQQSAQPELALEFLEFINTAENAASNAEYLYAATPHQGALKLLPAEFINDPLIFPDQKLLDRSEPYALLSPRTQKAHNEIMAELVKLKQ